MTAQATTIRNSFLRLSKQEQLELMHYFLKVVATPVEDEFTLPDNWKKELDRRDESYKNGASPVIPLDKALAEFGK